MEPKPTQTESQHSAQASVPTHNFAIIRRIPLGPNIWNVESDYTEHLEPLAVIIPRNRIINEQIIPLVDEALNRRHQLILDFKSQARVVVENEETRRMETDVHIERIQKLALNNENKRKEIVGLEKKLELQKRMSVLVKQQHKVDKLRSSNDEVEKQLQNILEETEMYNEFEKEIGISYEGKVKGLDGDNGIDSDEQVYLVTVTKIHQDFPDDPYHLYFSSFDFTKNGVLFTPVHIDPSFVEFQSLKSDFKNSTDLKGFISLVSDYWKRDARGKGAPRLATPRNQRQEKVIKGERKETND